MVLVCARMALRRRGCLPKHVVVVADAGCGDAAAALVGAVAILWCSAAGTRAAGALGGVAVRGPRTTRRVATGTATAKVAAATATASAAARVRRHSPLWGSWECGSGSIKQTLSTHDIIKHFKLFRQQIFHYSIWFSTLAET
jgi:hypothetical protein